MGSAAAALRQYRQTGVAAALEDASPHRLIALLLQGAIDRVTQAGFAIQRGAWAEKGRLIGESMSIIDALRAALNREAGGAVAEGLWSLYDYISRRLAQASAGNDVALLDEVGRLLREIRDAWDAVGHAPAPRAP